MFWNNHTWMIMLLVLLSEIFWRQGNWNLKWNSLVGTSASDVIFDVHSMWLVFWYILDWTSPISYRNKPGIFSKLPLELEFKGTMELTDFLSSVYISSPYGNEKHECSTVLASLSVNVIMASQGTVCEYNIAFELFIRFYFVFFFLTFCTCTWSLTRPFL